MDQSKISTSTAPSGSPQLTTILTWQHRFGAAHCLARVALGHRPLVVFSELRSNPDERGLSDDVAHAAEALLPLFEHHDVNPADIVWILHHGPFSYFDATGPETFTRVPLQWDGEHYTDNLTQHRRLQGDELNHELIHIALDPVPQVLAQLSKDATPQQP